MQPVAFPKPPVQFTTANGSLTREAHLFLQALWSRQGGADGPSVAELQAELDAAEASIDALETTVTALQVTLEARKLPVGSIFVTQDATNPATTLGYGTWSQVAQGRVLVGVDPGDADFDVVGEQGGSKTIVI